MKSSQTIVRLVSYSDLFDITEIKQLGEYLGGMSKDYIVKACAHFFTFKYSDPVHNNIPDLLGLFLGPSNIKLAGQIGSKLEALAKGREIRLLNNLALLEILEFALKEVDQSESFTEQQIEENFLKALLAVNENIIIKQKRVLETVGEVEGFTKGACLFLTNLIPYADIDNLNLKELLNSQVIRIIKLFKFIKSDSKLLPIYNEFLKQYGVTSWQDYLTAYLSIPFKIVSNLKKGRSEFVISAEPQKVRLGKLLDQFCISITEEFPQDFLQIRNNPLYKLSDDVYMVLYTVFVIEKIFKSVYFKMNAVNNDLPIESKVKNFKSEYCDKFSEQVIFYDIQASFFRKIPHKFSGNEILSKIPDFSAEPDYYAKRILKRGKTNLFIFESKDVLLNADAKVSFDFNLYKEELKKKFYIEIKTKPNGKQKIKPKAILQILNNIKRVILKQLPFDQCYHRRKMWIYPILVVHNNQIDVPGVNFLLNEWFTGEKEMLRKDPDLRYISYMIDQIRPLVLVNIDTLLFYQDGFQNIDIEKVIEAYYHFINEPIIMKNKGIPISEKTATQAYEPFSSFCSNYLEEKSIKASPHELLYLSKTIFEK